MSDSSAAPGTYLLLLECRRSIHLSIGKLGAMRAVPGYYLYVGSAFGPGGVRARVKHHRNMATSAHWHIDYLRLSSDIVDAWCAYRLRCEHQWARSLIQDRSVTVPLPGFGASDCACASHLFYFDRRPSRQQLEQQLGCKLETLNA